MRRPAGSDEKTRVKSEVRRAAPARSCRGIIEHENEGECRARWWPASARLFQIESHHAALHLSPLAGEGDRSHCGDRFNQERTCSSGGAFGHRRLRPAYGFSFSRRMSRIGVPGRSKEVAQIVDQIALVGCRHRVGAGAEQRERGRPRLRLRHVVEADAPPRDRRRRIAWR